MKIFLLGFMGSGKSYTGRHLASHLGFQFIDLDQAIINGEGRSIPEIFQDGEAHFRNLEADYLRKCSELENVIIATGGGTPCFNDNMVWMNENGITIYLSVIPEILCKRLSINLAKRPLLKDRVGQELEDFIVELLAEREFYYNQAQICYEVKEETQESWEELFSHLKKYNL